jgi:hypothetical protein
MWEPQPLTTLRASKACRGENFTFTYLYKWIYFHEICTLTFLYVSCLLSHTRSCLINVTGFSIHTVLNDHHTLRCPLCNSLACSLSSSLLGQIFIPVAYGPLIIKLRKHLVVSRIAIRQRLSVSSYYFSALQLLAYSLKDRVSIKNEEKDCVPCSKMV